MASGTTAPPAAPPPTQPPDEKGPSRFDVLLRDRKRLLIALALLLLAVAVAVGSAAIFTSSSANPTNTFSAGTLKILNDKDNAAILTATGMVPGNSTNGTVTITNTGSASGVFSLSAGSLTDTPGSGQTAKLSSVLTLQIVDLGSDGQAGGTGGAADTTIYGPNASFDNMPTLALGTWQGGEKHTYVFTVKFPDTGSAQNQYQGASTSITYTWNAVST